MLKHCTSSTSDLRARPLQNSAVKNEGCKLDMSSSEMAAAKRSLEDLKTSLRNVEQMETVFDTPKKGRSTPYVSSPVSRGRSLSLEPALAVAGASSPPSPSLAHRLRLQRMRRATSEPRAAISCLRVYTSCLLSEVEYRTVRIDPNTTAFEVVCGLLDRLNLRQTDPNLFAIVLEAKIGGSEVPVVEVSPKEQLLDLLSCLPWTGARARLVPRPGGLLRVHCPTLAGSGYKTIKVAADSTVAEVVDLLGLEGRLVESTPDSERWLESDEKPFAVASNWPQNKTGEEGNWRLELRPEPSCHQLQEQPCRDSKFSTAGPTIWTPPRTRRRTKSTSVSAPFSESHKPLLSLSKSHLPSCEMRKMANQNVNTNGTKLRSASARSPKDKHDSCARNQGQVGQDRVDVVQYEVADHINVQHVVNEEYMDCKHTTPGHRALGTKAHSSLTSHPQVFWKI